MAEGAAATHDQLLGTTAEWLTLAHTEADHIKRLGPAVALLKDLILTASVHTAPGDAGPECAACSLAPDEHEILQAIQTVLHDRTRRATVLYNHGVSCSNHALAGAAEHIERLAADLEHVTDGDVRAGVLDTYRACADLVRRYMLPQTHTPNPGRVPTATPRGNTSMTDTDTDFSQTASPIAEAASEQPETVESPAEATEAVQEAAEDTQETEGDFGPVETPAAEPTEDAGAQ